MYASVKLRCMDYFDSFLPDTPQKGGMMLAAPFLGDVNFSRAVILLCLHEEQGSVGYVLNHLSQSTLKQVLEEEIVSDFPIYIGGPVEPNTLHYLHTLPELIEESTAISEGLYWGQSFDQLVDLLKHEAISTEQLKFFAGYSGWTQQQLDKEIQEHSWIVQNTSRLEYVFERPPDHLWNDILREMGEPYVHFSHFPEDPTCN